MLAATCLSPTLAMAQSDSESEDKEAADIVAAQVRDQGYKCDDPVQASQDQNADGDAVWTITCENAAYHVRLVPDMAADIEVID